MCDLRHKVEVISGMNGVAMARHGLILWENGATASRKVSRYLPGLREAINNSKTLNMFKNLENSILPYFSVYSELPIYRTAADMLLLERCGIARNG